MRLEALDAYVQAGGGSRRLGRDKARVEIGNRLAIERVCDAAGRCRTRTIVASRPGDYADLGHRVIVDAEADLGPLGGLATAAADASAPSGWFAHLACDLPFLSRDILEGLCARIDDQVLAVVPLDAAGRAQSLCALYSSGVRESLAQSIADRQLSMREFLAKLPLREVPFRDLADLPGAEHCFLDLDTEADVAAARRLALTP